MDPCKRTPILSLLRPHPPPIQPYTHTHKHTHTHTSPPAQSSPSSTLTPAPTLQNAHIYIYIYWISSSPVWMDLHFANVGDVHRVRSCACRGLHTLKHHFIRNPPGRTRFQGLRQLLLVIVQVICVCDEVWVCERERAYGGGIWV